MHAVVLCNGIITGYMDESYKIDVLNKRKVVVGCTLLMDIVGFMILIINIPGHNRFLFFLTVSYLLLVSLAALVHRKTKNYRFWSSPFLILTGILFVYFFYQEEGTGVGVLWPFIFPFLAHSILGYKKGFSAILLFNTTLLLSFLLKRWSVGVFFFFDPFVMVYFLMLFALCIFMYLYHRRMELNVNLLSSESKKIQVLFNSLPQGIALISSDLRILEANDKLKEWFPDSALPDKPHCYYCFHKGQDRLICPDCQTIKSFEDGEVHFWFSMLKTAKGTRNFKLTSRPIKNVVGEVVSVVETLEDFTDVHKMQHKLEENEKRLSSLISDLPGFVYSCANDSEWTMEFLSEGFFDITGYHPDDLIKNKQLSYNDLILKEEREPIWEKWQDCLSKRMQFNHEYAIMTASGKIRWVWEQGHGVFSSKGELLRLEGFITDVTASLEVREALRQNAKDLAQMNVTKDKIFSIIAHDLRSPFQTFLGLTELISQKDSNLSPKEVRFYAGLMHQQALCHFQLLENLLEWSLLQRGLLHSAVSEVTVANFLKNLVADFEGCILKENMEVRIEAPSNLTGFFDQQMMGSVIRNLLSNALKFTENGCIILKAEKPDPGRLVFSVSDNGIGIPEDLLPDLFTVNDRKGRIGLNGENSTGLGLVLCKEFVDFHKGRIWVDSRVGSGSTFLVELPQKLSQTENSTRELDL
jgi:PAS domain S-box-containing protein